MSARTNAAIPAALLLLSAIPLMAGTLRLVQLSGGPELIAADQRISESPVPVIVHIIGAAVFIVVGSLQFLPGLRRRRWHRIAGRFLVVAGMLVAGSALWMTLFYAPKEGTGTILYAFRLLFGIAMIAAIALGYRAIRHHDIPTHRAWMIRAYALALAAGTQTLSEPVVIGLFGASPLSADLGKGAGWVINLAVAEWVIRRRPRPRTPRTPRTIVRRLAETAAS